MKTGIAKTLKGIVFPPVLLFNVVSSEQACPRVGLKGFLFFLFAAPDKGGGKKEL